MKIVYNATNKRDSDATEGHIRKALRELGHEVVRGGDGDVYLFHKDFNPPAEFTGKKVCWYFDKIWNDRVNWFSRVYPKIDLMFMTDWTWGKNYPRCRCLRQGIGDYKKGLFEKRSAEIAFIGSPYGEREEFCNNLSGRYGDRFKIYQQQFNRNLNNLCTSIPIIVAPKFPSDDDYWSNRVYLITGSNGFLIHPRLRGLEEEWGDNLVYYDSMKDLYRKIDYYLKYKEERETLRERAYNVCINNYTYKHRVKELISCIEKELMN